MLFRPEKRLSSKRFRLQRHKSPSSLTKLPSSREKIKTSKLTKSSPKKASRPKPTMEEAMVLKLSLMLLSKRRRRPLICKRWKNSYRNYYKADLINAIGI